MPASPNQSLAVNSLQQLTFLPLPEVACKDTLMGKPLQRARMYQMEICMIGRPIFTGNTCNHEEERWKCAFVMSCGGLKPDGN